VLLAMLTALVRSSWRLQIVSCDTGPQSGSDVKGPMTARRYPCFICHDFTEGADEYAVCRDCLRKIDREAAATRRQRDTLVYSPITPEVEAQLRRLLDDW
jgi:hypothetical protein